MVSGDRVAGRRAGAVDLSWRLRDAAGAGGRRGLALGDIVSAAVAIADADGLDAVSMARVAQRLGFSTMALYRHVPGKGELVELMLDAAAGSPPDTVDRVDDWREGLSRWAQALSAVYRRRTWMLDVPVKGPPATPNNLLWLETALAALRRTPLTPVERLGVVLAVSNFVRGNEQVYADIARMRREPDGGVAGQEPWERVLERVLPPGEFPEVRALLEFAPSQDDSLEEDLQFGLELLLDGIGARIASREAEGPMATA